MANLQANNAAGGAPRGHVRLLRRRHRHDPLPIYLAYLNGRRDAAIRPPTPATNWTNTDVRRPAGAPNPSPRTPRRPGRQPTRRANAIAAGLPANFFVVNPDVNSVNVTDSGAFSDYHALQIELRRRLSQGLSAQRQLPVRDREAARRSSASTTARVIESDGQRPARDQDAVGLDDPGRPRPAVRQRHDPVLDGMLGGWSFNGVGRIQARTLDFGNVRLVGMTPGRVQKMYKYRHPHRSGERAADGRTMLPDDVILNTRRAFSVSATTADRLLRPWARPKAATSRRPTATLHPAQGRRLRAARRS